MFLDHKTKLEIRRRLGDFETLWNGVKKLDDPEYAGNLTFACLIGDIWKDLVPLFPYLPGIFDWWEICILSYLSDSRAVWEDKPLHGRVVRIYGPTARKPVSTYVAEGAVEVNPKFFFDVIRVFVEREMEFD